MTLSEELTWRGFVNQYTFVSPKELDKRMRTLYLGIDPSADSMTIGHLAMAIMVKHMIRHGYKAVLLVGGATGMIGDPDGKATERQLQSLEQIKHNKEAITLQYQRLFDGQSITVVDNHDWFKDFNYLTFLRDIGTRVPLSQMLGREFVKSRLGDEGNGINYAEFSYALIQAYDFYYLHRHFGVDLQVCGSDQWGNSVAGVDLIRRLEDASVDVWSAPLIINPATGIKFGKSEDGAIWLDSTKTSPTAFYQFWINVSDLAVEQYLKIFTFMTSSEIQSLVDSHNQTPDKRQAQYALADSVTTLVHGAESCTLAAQITRYITYQLPIAEASEKQLEILKNEIPFCSVNSNGSVVQSLVDCGLASSKTQARQLLLSGAIYINQQAFNKEIFESKDFSQGRLLIRRGKAFKDTALILLG